MTILKIKNLVLLTLLLTAPGAWAETIDCTAITTLPYVITTQGIYCFTGHLATSMASGDAIDIQTNNVIIDLNGWKLGGLAAGTITQTVGIYAWQRKNITIKNGTIRGFKMGIYLNDSFPYTNSQGHMIEDIRADKNTWIGIRVEGRGNTVRRNQVVETGGSTDGGNTYGIQLYGPGARALNNDISATAATSSGNAYGLYLSSANGAVVEGNRIDDASSGSGTPYGIYFTSSNDAVVEDNRINRLSSTGNIYGIYINSSDDIVAEDNRIVGLLSNGGISYGMYIYSSLNVPAAGNRFTNMDYGIYYSAVAGGSTGKYMDNLTSGVLVPFNDGTPVGTND